MGVQPESVTWPEIDLTLCEREPIHIPGAIQPHGALLAVLADGFVTTHASASLATFLGLPAEAALGRPIEAALGEAASRALRKAVLDEDAAYSRDVWNFHTMTGPDGRPLRLRAFRSGRHICVDIQPVGPEMKQGAPETLLGSAMETFARASRSTELCALAVIGLKKITGYDRVMAYRFAEDGHGEVIAEAREPRMDSYLGLHYPASDVPPQARSLSLRQPVCLIADTSYSPTPLLSDAALDDGTPLDLSLSSLRSVSPIHREYLRNMKVAASLSVALTRRNKIENPTLWGMFVCHGDAPRIAGPELQSVLAMIGQVVSMLLRSLEEAEFHNELLVRNANMRALVERIALTVQSPQGLTAAGTELLQLVGATGALAHIGGVKLSFGQTPAPADADRALAILRVEAGGEVLAVDDLGLRHPELGACIAAGSGALLMPLPHPDDSVILWFRPEQARTVTWGGDPNKLANLDTATGRLSPRASFAAWRETQSGRSQPWSVADVAIVRELRRSVDAAVAERASAALARLRHYDPLTGLPNRSLLQERLTNEESGNDPLMTLLFLDLDGFKSINDTLGHSAGDALLIEVANRLVAISGSDNLVVRLGGDEFVVLCSGLTLPSVSALAERIRRAIEAPIEIEGRQCRVSTSIGVAVADQTGGLDLIRAADIAMYAAKRIGGNQAVVFAPLLHDRASMIYELEEDMRVALTRDDQFVLLYQPIFVIGSRSRQLKGFEALVRWRHPRHGWMSPAKFIPLADKSGLILPLGAWVLRTALRHGSQLREALPEANLTMNVNVSVLQILEKGYCLGVADALAAAGYPATALCLEVVESVLADRAAGAVLADLQKLGLAVAIDDFGIGYSSLSYLLRLPVDQVKLDRSFLEDIEGDPRGMGFAAAVVALAHSAAKLVVFEGIETEAQFRFARDTGADLVQGFLFAPPLSFNAALELVGRQRQLDGLP